jgi:fatty acyl-CoA reductase
MRTVVGFVHCSRFVAAILRHHNRTVMDIYETFRGKSVFFTGVTGFVGKVFLWKILKEFPEMDSIFCLIRTKKGTKPQDRLDQGVLSSPCFEPLRKQIGEEEWKRRTSKIVAVAGDIMEDRLGMSEQVYNTVASKVNFIVHMAATVNFDERLDISVQMNVLGSLRVMALAQKSPKLQAYVHMSTCYVNFKRHSRQVVRETIYPLDFDAEDMCKFILAQDPSMMPVVTNRVLKQHGFPNTYTLTKAMGEQILERRKGSLPMTIIRPAIVGCAWREPMPGWVDALTAAGGIYLTSGLGILRELHCKPDIISDLIPVDYVVNATIKLLHRTSTFYQQRRAATTSAIAPSPRTVAPAAGAVALAAGAGKRDFLGALSGAKPAGAAVTSDAQRVVSSGSSAGTVDGVAPSLPFVYHASSSSSLNLMRWETASAGVHQYWNSNPHPKAIHKCDMTLVDTYSGYLFRTYTRRIIPLKVMKLAASLPIVGNPERKKLVARLERAVFRGADMQRQFAPFMNNEWCFDASNTNSLDESLKPEHQKAFSCDIYDINWHAYTMIYSYGMVKYIMKAADGRSAPQIPEGASAVYTRANL